MVTVMMNVMVSTFEKLCCSSFYLMPTGTPTVAKDCDHSKDRCGCYLALLEEKSLLDYKLKKYQSKQTDFLEALRKAVLETVQITNDEAIIIELTKLGKIVLE